MSIIIILKICKKRLVLLNINNIYVIIEKENSQYELGLVDEGYGYKTIIVI